MRRKYVRALGAMGLSAALIAAAGCQAAEDDTAGGSGDCGGKIAMFGAYSGPNSGLAIPALKSAQLAVKQHNEANPDCEVTLQEFDTKGDPTEATPVANRVAGDASFLGVIGGAFSGESKATMDVYEAAEMVMVSPSSTAIELTAGGNEVFHRVVGNDAVQGAAAAVYLRDVVRARKVFVINDGTTYGAGITDELTRALGELAGGTDQVQEKQVNFAATISKIKAAAPDAIAYGGYSNEAAPLVKQMREAGVTATFLGLDGIYDPSFPEGAGASAEGAIVTCLCLPSDKAGGTFAADFEAEYGVPPGPFGAEGFDAANVLIEGLAEGNTTRKDLLAWVDSYDKEGVSKSLKFDENGDVDKSRVVTWAYEIKGGEITAQQEIKLS
ncbi:branched-chain amino acid ABC transporter substrate-binding protein [Salinispora arenicola]|uniref:Extracellular ligand-binding receptor n=1 Tax=Salinispora arenicola (strain CNS-205) TaxID=391037 RepID=A8LXP7_SALAI|nr:branched-chain amino acid ABC transporter substrate-binding protein [Salinispora arenicola]MCN0179331.1 branched-chain amino acid ABC transporter substrate-binding protein [Salinispora arenicola]NIL58321.1 branched-chain amino acid ABC transporter substrate-binding protein [Salinispora arenicola]